jgi:HEAT repeat protein
MRACAARTRLTLAAALACAALACADEHARTPARGAPATRAPSSFCSPRAIVTPRILALEAELAALPAPALPEGLGAEDLRAEVEGCIALVTGSDARMREAGREQVLAFGPACSTALAAVLASTEAGDDERRAAAELLGALDAPQAAEALLVAARSAEQPWLRALCTRELGRGTQGFAVPRLVLCLKYELDDGCALALAEALARHGNGAGLDALETVRARARDEALRARAQQLGAELASAAQCASADELRARWEQGTWPVEPRTQDAREQLALWRSIAALSEWQLRGVDDARFVLSRLGREAAPALAEALCDENAYVRTHALQCLERMGARAQPAGEQLVLALGDPSLAADAALALGASAHERAQVELEARIAPAHALELRVQAARGLGRLPHTSAAPAVPALERALAPQQPVELRQAAAEALLLVAEPAASPSALAALAVAADLLQREELEPSGTESAARAWFARSWSQGDASAQAALACWDALAPAPNQPRSPGAERARRAARAGLMSAWSAPRADAR